MFGYGIFTLFIFNEKSTSLSALYTTGIREFIVFAVLKYGQPTFRYFLNDKFKCKPAGSWGPVFIIIEW